MELTSLQLSTTNEILNLYNPNEKVVCEFKSPTGSGKTLMATYFISALINQNPSDRFIFVIATPSSSSLPYFFEQKINKYKINLPYSKFEVEYIQSPSTTRADKSESIPKIIPEQNKVYIFGKASFGKNRILSEFGIINDFVISAKDKGYKLVYIRDEAHIGGEDRTNDENFETVMNQNASFVLKMTATPDNNNPLTKKVILTENQLNDPALNDDKWLLKTKAVSLVNSDMNNENILNDAINQFRDIKNKYAELNIGINPAMLIQVNNNSPSNPERRQAFNQAIEKIKNTLNGQNISWVQYFGDNDKDSNRVYKDKFTLDDITENNNDIDAIIFKIGPSTGWDIPRACMLVQLREVSSANLNIQTIGRIKRNPYPNLEKNPITDEYYVYSNIENTNNETKEYNYQVNQRFSAEEFLSVDITNKNEIKTSKSNDQFKDNFCKWLNVNKNNLIQEIGTVFVENKTYRKVLQNVNGHQIYTELTNPFIFLRDYNRLINANKQLYNLIESISEDFCNKNNVQKEFLITVLFDLHKRELLECVSRTRIKQPKYKISLQKYSPDSYVELYELNKETRGISAREYLFEINKYDPVYPNMQPLDSTPEIIVFNQIQNFIGGNNNVKVWAKNLKTSNIFGEYLDDTLNVRKSFFDFILKFTNNFYLYIEVKGIPDINADKTELLKKAYTDYFDNLEYDLFSKRLAIAVWEVNKDNGSIQSSVYYDKRIISDDLNTLPAVNLLKKLSSL